MSNTEKYLANIKSKVGTWPQLEENNRMLHMNSALTGWREWMILTYDHNVLGDMIASENKHLKKKIEEIENKLRKINIPLGMYPGWPGQPENSPYSLSFPRTMQTRSGEFEEQAAEKLDENLENKCDLGGVATAISRKSCK